MAILRTSFKDSVRRDIDSLAGKYGNVPYAKVSEIYWKHLKGIYSGAKVKTFLLILANAAARRELEEKREKKPPFSFFSRKGNTDGGLSGTEPQGAY